MLSTQKAYKMTRNGFSFQFRATSGRICESQSWHHEPWRASKPCDRRGCPQGRGVGGPSLRGCHLRLWWSPLLGHVWRSRPPPRSVWQGRGKAIQKDILLSLHIFCALKYLRPRHTWRIKKYYTPEECWNKVLRQRRARLEKQM